MANGILREKLKTRIASALAEVASASDIEHTEMRGDVAEHAFRELIGDLVPAWAKIGTGKIVDAQGGQSLQIDTAMYSPFVLPPILVHKKGDDLLIPVEACISTVEVKSRLNAPELRRAIANAHSVRALSYVGAPHRQQKAMAANGPTCCLLALSTDLAADGKSELERYIEQDPQAMRTPTLNMVCVLGRGLWLFGASGLWQYWQHTAANASHDEVIDFLSVLANSVPNWIRQAATVVTGHYFIETRPFDRFYDDGNRKRFDARGSVILD